MGCGWDGEQRGSGVRTSCDVDVLVMGVGGVCFTICFWGWGGKQRSSWVRMGCGAGVMLATVVDVGWDKVGTRCVCGVCVGCVYGGRKNSGVGSQAIWV